jgi:hypothetical protein
MSDFAFMRFNCAASGLFSSSLSFDANPYHTSTIDLSIIIKIIISLKV